MDRPTCPQHDRQSDLNYSNPTTDALDPPTPSPPNPQAGNCGYSQFECQSAKATLPGVMGTGGAPVKVSHHPAAHQLQQVMQQGAQQVGGWGDCLVSAVLS